VTRTAATRGALIALLLAGCTPRAAIGPPRVPLTATPSDALPEPPTSVWPSEPLRLRLVRRELANGFRILLSRGEPNGVVSVAFVSSATPRWASTAVRPRSPRNGKGQQERELHRFGARQPRQYTSRNSGTGTRDSGQ